LGLTALLSWFGFYDVVLLGNSYRTSLAIWISCGSFHAEWCLLLDSLSATMLVVITTVSFLVHCYSTEYMKEDPHSSRFFCYISLFTFFMVMLVTADNLVQLFFGWEGVGLCSYLLIGFWYTRVSAGRAALKAVIVNRVADVFILLGMGGCFAVFGSLNYGPIFLLAPLFELHGLSPVWGGFSAIDIICLLLFGGAMGKSAQVGLHTWLPDAMEGPTPVSALIHAATMVTAGVFLVVRCSPLFEYSGCTLFIISIVGVLTSFMAATIALVQNDIKKIIAYSTCSQLGYMFLACGLSNYAIGMFHLFNHAFFKALLFLSAGSVIHAYGDEQDLRGLGGAGSSLPLTYICFLIGSISLAGFPFMSGFYSKELILSTAAASCTPSASFYFWIGSLTAFMTAFYSFRLFFLGLVRTTGSQGCVACN
jgi:proton-translocating NADH-quinone oxidoreductase chain L